MQNVKLRVRQVKDYKHCSVFNQTKPTFAHIRYHVAIFVRPIIAKNTRSKSLNLTLWTEDKAN